MNRRWDSDQLTLWRLLDERKLGEVLRYESRLERWQPALSGRKAWREIASPEAGGGVLLDLGSHLVDQAIGLFGAVVRVYAELESRRGGVADDDAFVALEHRSGARSHLWASLVAAAPGPRLRVLGDRAAYVVTDVDGQEDALRAGARPSGDEAWGIEPPERWGRLITEERSEAIVSERGDWPRFYIGLERALREGSPAPVDPWEAVTGLEVLDAARRSAATATVARVGGRRRPAGADRARALRRRHRALLGQQRRGAGPALCRDRAEGVVRGCYLRALHRTLLNRRLVQARARRQGDPILGRIAGQRHNATLFRVSPTADPGSTHERGRCMDATRLPGFRRNLKTAMAGGALAIGLAVAAFALTAVEVQARPTCDGRKATIVRGDGNDVISVPKHGPQVIIAGGGSDTIIAKRNKDTVCSGDGDDFISGGTGRDRLFGEAGNDVIDEGPGSGKAYGGPRRRPPARRWRWRLTPRRRRRGPDLRPDPR